jgi:GT2 family glycosyltransferase
MSEDKHETVAAVVVTYNRKDLLRQCLDGILRQTRPVDAIYVVDNASTDGTPEMIASKYAGRVIYERLSGNVGGAGGFHHGMKRAYEDGHDWIWVMDDDAEPDSRCLECLLQWAPKEAGCVVPSVVSQSGVRQNYHAKRLKRWPWLREIPEWFDSPTVLQQSAIPLDAAGFPGCLVGARVIRSVGLPDPAFFILYDDTDYTLRISRFYPLYVIPQATLIHKDDRSTTKPAKSEHTNWKTYYAKRNRILLARKHEGWAKAILLFGWHVLRSTVGAIRPEARPLGRYLRLRIGGAWAGLAVAKLGEVERPPQWLRGEPG